ncbi:hypothetical protein [Dryocola sp. BD586]|uniref:hypothetical protein n=1 Tax=Dryocola sp. BD586 TaxID=3133271 RepID=UPI003F50A88A
MKKEHVLIQFATKRPFSSKPEMPESSVYSQEKGYWMKDEKPLVSYDSEYGTRVSKKCDIETGEDQKGE